MAEKKQTEAAAPETPKASGMNMKWVILIVLLSLIFALAGGAGTYFLLTGGYLGDLGHAAAPAPEPEPSPLAYQALDPLTVNLAAPGPVRFLRIVINFTSRDADTLTALQRHLPRIRNALLMHLGTQSFAVLNTPAGKDALRGELREIVTDLLHGVNEHAEIEGVLFTEFVMQ